MNAIQRWYLYSERGSERLHEAAKGPDMILDGTEQFWCKAEDVAELERVITDQSGKHKQIVTSLRERIHFLERTGMDTQNDISAERREHRDLRDVHKTLEAKYDVLMGRFPDSPSTLYKKLDAMLAHCGVGECSTCATIICPHQDGMHFHHDGCPSCAEAG